MPLYVVQHDGHPCEEFATYVYISAGVRTGEHVCPARLDGNINKRNRAAHVDCADLL